MGRDPPPGQKNNLRSISIHSPAWGATTCNPDADSCVKISIHAPAWGATFVSVRIGRLSPHFNPRARVGRDCAAVRTADGQRHFNPRAHGARGLKCPGAQGRGRVGMSRPIQETQISTRIKTREKRGAACRKRYGSGQEQLTRTFYELACPERHSTLGSYQWI